MPVVNLVIPVVAVVVVVVVVVTMVRLQLFLPKSSKYDFHIVPSIGLASSSSIRC